MPFKHKEMVEICKKREGFSADAYYLQATFLSPMPPESSSRRCLVQHHTLLKEDEAAAAAAVATQSKYGCKVGPVEEELVRPIPPRELALPFRSNYAVLQKVDAYDNGAWWVGRVLGENDDGCYYVVRLDIDGFDVSVPFFLLRNHLQWRDGEWFHPPPSRRYVPAD
ncbi:DUF724 domain-containing protein 3-like [Humulus lupulus]|uniref:DUF724 domain-containing protein 3-like n=1 Tax=Humulus lupulus TaxID=3486 RepID=UPI002B408EB6|nr:DUF724 domain-containing protein 3-like [Humulus lupulus]